MSWLKNLFGSPAGPPPPKERDHAIVLLLREPITFNRDVALRTAERAFNRSFPGGESLWFVVCSNDFLAVVSTDQHNMHVFAESSVEFDPDEETKTLPELKERQTWAPYTARISTSLVTGSVGNPAARQAMIAKLALPLIQELGANCVGIYDSFNRLYTPQTPEAVAQLQQLAAGAPE